MPASPYPSKEAILVTAVVVWFLALAAAQSEPRDVRQIVTFDFAAGKNQDALALFRDEALPIYEKHPDLVRFRGYREAESPTPTDLVVVSTFRGMAGMDAFHESLRESSRRGGPSIGSLYGRIGALSREHRDTFFEVDPALSWGDSDKASSVVLVSTRIAPGKADAYETLVREHLVPWEKTLGETFHGVDGGAFLVSDGWDYMRRIGVESLGDWHRYLSLRRAQPWAKSLDEMLTAEQQKILVPVRELSVR